jgi:hypothetical protein
VLGPFLRAVLRSLNFNIARNAQLHSMVRAPILEADMKLWPHFRKLLAYLAPEYSFGAYPAMAGRFARKQIAVLTVLLAVAAIGGAVVLTPSRRSGPDPWAKLREHVADRAQVDLFEDFSGGLDAWQSGENIAGTWSYDKNGFVNPGALSLFAPSMHLTNYDLDALVQIETKGVGLVFRAAGLRSYQAVQVLVEGSGPMPALVVARYSVVGGRASRPVRVAFPSRFQADTLYRLHLQVRGDAFSLYIQGQLADYWSDNRLPAGGVGLFCGPGEHARVASIRVSQNTDSLGRMCSLLASVL